MISSHVNASVRVMILASALAGSWGNLMPDREFDRIANSLTLAIAQYLQR